MYLLWSHVARRLIDLLFKFVVKLVHCCVQQTTEAEGWAGQEDNSIGSNRYQCRYWSDYFPVCRQTGRQAGSRATELQQTFQSLRVPHSIKHVVYLSARLGVTRSVELPMPNTSHNLSDVLNQHRLSLHAVCTLQHCWHPTLINLYFDKVRQQLPQSPG